MIKADTSSRPAGAQGSGLSEAARGGRPTQLAMAQRMRALDVRLDKALSEAARTLDEIRAAVRK